ncbi:MAG: DUF4169 domain-containing protein [Rhodospirillaceae bacterium]|nr:DUF4169 domain-containing protein [Rhodospirillaceae bacterium]
MGDLVNLNEYRKQRARRDAASRAAEKRIKHGRTREERTKAAMEAERADAGLDGKRLDDDVERHDGKPEPDESQR